MADPISLTLGLAPVVGGMVKSYQTVYRKLKLFGRADREVDRIRKCLDRQRHVFANETHLLLRLVVNDEEQIETLVSDGDHETWTSSDLDKSLTARLGRSYEALQGIVEDIGTNMNYLLRELDCFEALDCGIKDEGVRLKVQRLRSAAKLTFDKSKCDQAIQNLRTANDDLKRLREQALDMQPRAGRLERDKSRRSDLAPKLRSSYAYCAKIRRAARALHEGLARSLPSSYHDVRLFLEATVVDDNTITDLAILCASQETVERNIVQVRSRPVEWLPTSLAKDPDPLTEAAAGTDGPRKRQKVRWLDQNAEPEEAPETLDHTEEKSHLAQDLCLEICQGNGCRDVRWTKNCLCYVETSLDQTFRHEFYPRGGKHHRPTELATFDDMLHHPVETSISMVDQLKLARTIVSAVLYFSSTPWLAEYWGMKDLCFFLDRDDLSTSLRTLNLGVKFLGKEKGQFQTTIESSAMEGIDSTSVGQQSSPAIDEAMLVYGIRNMTLHSLGVVLLQIGRWNRIEPDDVLQVRRLSRQVSRLGPKYRDLTQKCLDCDFGRGSNLARPQLQQAVYEDVVEELDSMIKCLDISHDDVAP